jgi:hypothetical protein
MHTCRGHDGDRGQVMPLAAAMLALATVVLLALVPVGRALGARTQARTSADAAALAGAASGEDAARRLARANGGELLSFSTEDGGGRVVVRVRVGGVTAYASARATRPARGGGAVVGAGAATGAGTGDRAGLAPAMLGALARADALLGREVPVASGLRTRAEQEALWARRASNPYPVARPGTSDHETGLAVDVPRGFVDDLVPVAPAAGLCQPLPESDPVHFVVCGT